MTDASDRDQPDGTAGRADGTDLAELADVVLGGAGDAGRDALARRAAAEPSVARDVQSVEATLAALALAAPAAAAPLTDSRVDPLRARLLARASADAAARSEAHAPAATPEVPATPATPVVRTIAVPDRALVGESVVSLSAYRRRARLFTGAAVLAAAASLLLLVRAQGERRMLDARVASLEGERAAAQVQLDSLARALGEREQQLASVTGPDVAVVELASTSALPPSGRMFWDRAAARWTFVANNLPALPPGRTYSLWLVTASERILAGNFTPDGTGTAVVRATYDLPRAALQAVAVTEEPASGVSQPTGPILLVGSPAGSAD